MQEIKKDFDILIVGSDIRAYNMARSYHELYNKKVDIIGKDFLAVTGYSDILNINLDKNLDKEDLFSDILNKFIIQKQKENPNIHIILIGTSDKYVELILLNKHKLHKNFIYNYADENIVKSFLAKDIFYTKYKHVLNVPHTLFFDCKKSFEEESDVIAMVKKMIFPIILKPSDGIKYFKNYFLGQAKVYKIKNLEELKNIISQIINAGYRESLIIQEFIEGGDEYLFDVMLYANSKGAVEVMTFAQIGLQERTKTGVGNATVLINGYSTFNNKNEINKTVQAIKFFLESINFTGFAEVDLKYDLKSGTFKVLEINPRQARCSYYMTFAGFNMIKILIDDLIYKKENKFEICDKKIALSFVPKFVLKKYINNKEYVKEFLNLEKQGMSTKPLFYNKDKNLKRRIYLLLQAVNYVNKYRKSNW